MINLPLHNIDKDYKDEFESYLNQTKKKDKYFLINQGHQIVIFSYKDQASNYLKTFNLNLEIKVVEQLEQGFEYNVAPCNYCRSKDYITCDIQKVEMRLYEQDFIESLYLKVALEQFRDKNIQRLLMLSQDILEHFNPESPLGHFYLGFCFFVINDEVNYKQVINNLQRLDPKLANQLAKFKV